MNVTKDNFEAAAAEIEALLPRAAFVSIDEEMTGISVSGQQERIEDTPAARYLKMRGVASRYNIIQFGMAIFVKDDDNDNYVAHVYNFYIFPETGPINMDGSAIAFNRSHGMDWNKWIREGIPYLNRVAAQKLAGTKEEKPSVETKDAPRTRIALTKASDIETTGNAIVALKNWLGDESKKDETEFEVITTNAYLRRFFYEALQADFPDLIVESRPTAARGMSTLVALRMNEEQKQERATRLRLEKEAQVARKVGFRRVFQALADAKKPLIGHAVMFDLLFALAHFEGSLPESYLDFKKLVRELFPILFDTQLLAKREPFKFVKQAADVDPKGERKQRFGSMALGAVYKVFADETAAAKLAGQSIVQISFAPGHDRYGPDCNAFHEAGYDAYITGYAFAHMAEEALSTDRIPIFNGRTTMFRSLFDFNLTGEDEFIAEGVYVHVGGLKGRDSASLKEAFVKVKAPLVEVTECPVAAEVVVRWIDDDNAFAVLPEACRDDVTQSLKRPRDEGGLVLTSWNDWLAAENAKDAAKAAEIKEPPKKRARTGE